MHGFIYYLIIFLTAGTIFSLNFFVVKKTNKLAAVLKIVSICLAVAFLFRYMLGDEAIRDIFELSNTPIVGKFKNFVALMCVWFTYSSVLLLCLYPFFKIRQLTTFIKYFATPILILDICLLSLNFTAIMGVNSISKLTLRGICFVIELGIALGYCMFVWATNTNWKILFFKRTKQVENKEEYNKNSKFKNVFVRIVHFFKKHYVGIVTFVIIILSPIPSYALQGLFGYLKLSYTLTDFTLPHRIILYGAIILPIILHLTFKRQEFDVKKFNLLFICLGTLITFSLTNKFDSFENLYDWPIHLCNTAMYIMPIVLIFNLRKFFYFTYFINVAGALIAMLMPDYNIAHNILSREIVGFYVNHYIAFFMPLLFVSLKMFERPKFKEFLYSIAGFAVYYVFVLIVNASYTGLFELGKVTRTTDFFFTNSDFVADKLGKWCENLRDNSVASTVVKGVKLTFYPLYQLLFFVCYIGIGLICWFIYEQMHELTITLQDIKAKKQVINLDMLALSQKLNGRSFKEPMNPENGNKLILKDFTKKYGNSNVFAVKDANLEVIGGEIFGFLGPNGAGKSTIIKSIVGIQPITKGNIEVCGYDVGTQSVQSKREIGYVPDHYALYEKLTGREYINYIADLYNVSQKDRDERITNLVERLNLRTAFDNQIKTYSHGMKQKIAIIAALVHNPKVWILDEPLTGLDPDSIFQVKECMKEHKQKGNIVFFSSHIIDVVERICDRIAIIKKGNILVTKSIEEIEESGKTLEEFYMNTISEEQKK